MNEITMTGNLVYDPVKRLFGERTMASLRLAHTPRFRDTQGEWKDGDTTFLDVTCWGRLAINVCESLSKGSAIIVSGRLQAKERGGEDGAPKRTYYDIIATVVGPDLNAYATMPVQSKGDGASRQEAVALAEVGAVPDGWVRVTADETDAGGMVA